MKTETCCLPCKTKGVCKMSTRRRDRLLDVVFFMGVGLVMGGVIILDVFCLYVRSSRVQNDVQNMFCVWCVQGMATVEQRSRRRGGGMSLLTESLLCCISVGALMPASVGGFHTDWM